MLGKNRLIGILRGGVDHANCTVAVTRIPLPASNYFVFFDHAIDKVSKKLPDGNYLLQVHGASIPMVCQNGCWMGYSSLERR
jgi:hypothetical protein